jgi:23S rRNA (cytosine1962-C5)-methyltransferase
MNETYQLIDSGSGQKLERFGPISLIRPCPQAVWRPMHPEVWKEADGHFSRSKENRWEWRKKAPASWIVEIEGVRFQIAPTDFGHLGVFPEHATLWTRARSFVKKGDRVLNLFAYSGGVSLAAAQAGAHVCHVDASKGMVDWARENAALNELGEAPIRWIVDDVMKFLKREARRESKYEGIILDPPTFGRGSKGEVFKIESELQPLLEACRDVLADRRHFLILSCHTPGFTPLVLGQVLQQLFKGQVETGELMIEAEKAFSIPSGCYAIHTHQ